MQTLEIGQEISKELMVGTEPAPDGGVYVWDVLVTLKCVAAQGQTIGLDDVPAGSPLMVLSFSGTKTHKRGGRYEVLQGGQVRESLAKVLHEGRLTNPHFLLQAMLNLWEDWHLNDMNAGCIHQKNMGWRACPGHYDRNGLEACGGGMPGKPVGGHYHCTADKVGVKCEVCGYAYGSKWLVCPLPLSVERQVWKIINEEVAS